MPNVCEGERGRRSLVLSLFFSFSRSHAVFGRVRRNQHGRAKQVQLFICPCVRSPCFQVLKRRKVSKTLGKTEKPCVCAEKVSAFLWLQGQRCILVVRLQHCVCVAQSGWTVEHVVQTQQPDVSPETCVCCTSTRTISTHPALQFRPRHEHGFIVLA